MKLNINQEDLTFKEQTTILTYSQRTSPIISTQIARKSAFRPYSGIEDTEGATQQDLKNSSSQSTLWQFDPTVDPLNHYIFQQLNSLMTLSMEPGKLVFYPEQPEMLAKDQWSSDSNKSKKQKNPLIEEISSDLKKNNKIKNSQQSSSKKCCNCKKSRCLMLYCECFRAGQICQGCNCFSCLNTLQNNTERLQARNKCLQINPLSFSVGDNKVSSKGCKCRKSGCRKKYCQCFQQGKQCTELCICIDCQNHFQSRHHHHRRAQPLLKPIQHSCSI